jgi:hypothetical protein
MLYYATKTRVQYRLHETTLLQPSPAIHLHGMIFVVFLRLSGGRVVCRWEDFNYFRLDGEVWWTAR